jgi:hypothetical protein
MHALHLPSWQALRAALLAGALAVVLMTAAAGLDGLGLGSTSGSGAAAAGSPAPPAGPASWVRDPMTPPTILLAR